jgi:hypothetical protein
MYGRIPNSPINYETDPETHMPIKLDQWRKHMEEVQSLILPAVNARVRVEQSVYRTRLDNLRRKLVTSPLRKGTKVEVKDPKYLLSPKPAVEATYIGPYYVVKVNKYGAYVLQDQHGKMLDRTVPLDQIKVRGLTDSRGKRKKAAQTDVDVAAQPVDDAMPVEAPPSSDAGKGEEKKEEEEEDDQTQEYDVDEILDHKQVGSEIHYYVKWTGYKEKTWEPQDNFNDRAVIDRYWRNRAAKRQLRTRRAVIKRLSHGSLSLVAARER